jgi:hypothetical protein
MEIFNKTHDYPVPGHRRPGHLATGGVPGRRLAGRAARGHRRARRRLGRPRRQGTGRPLGPRAEPRRRAGGAAGAAGVRQPEEGPAAGRGLRRGAHGRHRAPDPGRAGTPAGAGRRRPGRGPSWWGGDSTCRCCGRARRLTEREAAPACRGWRPPWRSRCRHQRSRSSPSRWTSTRQVVPGWCCASPTRPRRPTPRQRSLGRARLRPRYASPFWLAFS